MPPQIPKPAEETHPLLGSQIDGYRLIRLAGVGGMGVVFEGVNEQLGRRAAVKVLHKEMAEDREVTIRFLNEARAAQIIGHPALVAIYGCGELPDGAPYMIMEFLEGQSLGTLLANTGGKFETADAIAVVRQVAEALAAAHAKNIIHRDLKPENVMLGEDPGRPGRLRAKVFDFGLAKMRQEDMADRGSDATVLKTQTGRLVGTPTYMAPEQCDEDGRPDQHTDVYALGVMFYECLAGRPPFKSELQGNARIIEVLAMHLGAKAPPLQQFAPQAPPQLVELVHAMLHKDQKARPSMAEVAAVLAELERPPRTWRLYAALAATTVAAMAISALALWLVG